MDVLISNPSNHSESVEKENYSDTVVLTSTLYDDSRTSIARSQAARDFLSNSAHEGIRVIMCDGGSGEEFLTYAKSFSNVTVLEYHDDTELQKSHFPRRQNGMGYILKNFPDARYIYWIEPEKADLMTQENLSKVLIPLREGKAEQVIPSPKPHDNRPAYMRAIEMRAMRRAMDIVAHGEFRSKEDTYSTHGVSSENEVAGLIYGEPKKGEKIIDHWFGPRAFTREIAEEYFMKSKRKIWDGIILPSAKAQSERGSTVGVNVSFGYAQQQLTDESDPVQIPTLKRKRLAQYQTLIRAFREDFGKRLKKNT